MCMFHGQYHYHDQLYAIDCVHVTLKHTSEIPRPVAYERKEVLQI